MNQNSVINFLSQTYCRIKPSGIHGVGVFAIADIPKGINPFPGSPVVEYEGVEPAEIASLDSEVADMVNAFFAIQKGKVWIPVGGLNSIDISFFMNTSKTPNVGVRKEGDEFVALDEIKKGEELLIDYREFDERKN